MKYLVHILFSITIVLISVGCASLSSHPRGPLHESESYYNYLQPTFSDYLQSTETWLSEHRAYISEQHTKEMAMNMPFEIKPQEGANKAILLIHGLGDSPYSFSDLGNTLSNQGFHVQTLLLPGHGSKPSDLMLPMYEDWQKIVDHYANLLKEDYEEVWLGGFSTGGNLATIHTIEQGDIDGLLLFSPGFQSRTPWLEKLAPFASLFFDGYSAEEKNLARYTSAPLQGAIAYSDSAQKLRDLFEVHTVAVPTLIAISEADSIIDPEAVQSFFIDRFTNPSNELILYGESKTNENSIKTLSMKLENLKISTGSHMSALFSPLNTYYGKQGERKMCMNSFSDDAISRCEAGETVWYSAWGYEEAGKIHARLTWNPYYSELEKSIRHLTQINSL